MTEPAKYQVINPPNLIQAKVTGGGGIDPELLRKIDTAIADLKGDFERRARDQIAQLQHAYAQLQSGGSVDGNLGQVYKIAHDLKGQGGTFGYALVSELGKLLCVYVDRLGAVERRDLEILKILIDSLAGVVGRRVEGDGGEVGQELLEELYRIVGPIEE